MATSDATALMLKMSADNTQILKSLDQVTKKLQGLPSEWGSHGKKAAHELEKGLTGEGFGAAIKKVFDSSRLAVLEEGSAKLRLFGSALEPLGALGLAAAGGVAALGLALERAHEAVEFADSLFKLAKLAHVTTDELQQTQFALRMAGGNAAEASTGLQSFSATLGKASAGLPKALKGFQELWGKGFTAEDVKRLGDTGQALDAVVEKIAGLKSTSQKDAVISQLGLDSLKPLIEDGIDKWREFKAEAIASGNVMDEHLVKRGHELNEEIEKVTGKIKVQLAEAFVNLGPILLKLLGYLGQMAEFAEKVAAAASPLEARGTTDIQRELRGYQARQAGNDPLKGFYAKSDRENIARAQAELAKRAKEKPEGPPAGTGTLTDVSHHATPRDDTVQRTEALNATLADERRKELEAQKALTADVEARAEFERQALAEELKSDLAKLEKQRAEVEADKGISKATKDKLGALINEAETAAKATSAAKVDLVNRDEQFAVQKQLNDATVELSDMMNRQLSAQASIAPTAAKRAALELEIFKYQQDSARLQYKYNLALEVATKHITQAEADDRLRTFDKTESAELGAQRQQQLLNANPVAAYLDSLKDVNKVMQQDGVQAAQDLSQALTDVATGAKSFGQAMLDMFRNLFAKLLEQSLERDVVGPALGGLGSLFGFPGHASGTTSSPGGWHWVGENGPELMNVTPGAQVIPNNQAMSALKNMSVPQGGGGVTIVQPFHFHAEGAVMTSELLAQANQQAAKYAQKAYVSSLRDGRNGLPDALRAHQLLRG